MFDKPTSKKTAGNTVLSDGGNNRPILDADDHGEVVPKINQRFFSILPAQPVNDFDQIPHILHREILPVTAKAFFRVTGKAHAPLPIDADEYRLLSGCAAGVGKRDVAFGPELSHVCLAQELPLLYGNTFRCNLPSVKTSF